MTRPLIDSRFRWISYTSISNYNPLNLCLFIVSILIFLDMPQLDIEFSQLFFSSDVGFKFADYTVVKLLHWVFGKIHFLYLIALLTMLGLPEWLLLKHVKLCKRRVRFLLFLLILGPGLVVNVGLKDNFNGRARPDQVTEFGGKHLFTSPFVITEQCDHNCSFVSGHASAGFVLIGLAWAYGSTGWLLLGTAAGFAVGLGRIAQGGHFLSDVLFAYWVTYFVSLILAWRYGLTMNSAIEPHRRLIGTSVHARE